MKLTLAAFGLLLAASAASAQDLPCSPLRVVVPYPPGGATDVAARLVVERLEPALKKTVVIENRAGATGNIGTVAVAQSTPDGCTLLVNAASIASFTASFTRLGYDPFKDLTPVGGIGLTPTMLVTATASPPNDLKTLIEWGKSKPDGLTLSTAGYGLIQHLAAEEIGRRTGIKLTHILYRGGAPAMTDLVTGRVDLGSFAAGSMLPLLKDKQLKALAVIAPKRSALAPDVPTIDEQGLSGINSNVQFMMLAPGCDAETGGRLFVGRAEQGGWRSGAQGPVRRHRLRAHAEFPGGDGRCAAQDRRRLDSGDPPDERQDGLKNSTGLGSASSQSRAASTSPFVKLTGFAPPVTVPAKGQRPQRPGRT